MTTNLLDRVGSAAFLAAAARDRDAAPRADRRCRPAQTAPHRRRPRATLTRHPTWSRP